MEKYSVLMSLYYKEKPEFLKQAIRSMIDQTIKPDEIVIVYDGKLTPELYQTMDEFINKFPELFTIIENKKNIGLGLSLNRGLEVCRNEFIARMDTDDISLLDRCEKQLNIFKKNSNLDICSGYIDEFIGEPGNIVSTRCVPKNNEEIYEYIKKRCPINHVAAMFKKKSVINAGGYLDCFWNEDYYLWIRMYEKEAIFANIDNPLVLVRIGKEMYQRRGGKKYFKSEVFLQNYMLKKKIINYHTYILNIIKRFIVQILLPSKIRGIVFRKYARRNKI